MTFPFKNNASISVMLIAVLFAGIYYSCKKKKARIIMNSQVYDPKLNKGVSDASVSVSAQVVEAGAYHGNFKRIASVQTDADGRFHFEMDNQLIVAYRISISKSGYFNETREIKAEKVKVNETYSDTYHIYPEAWFTLQVHTNAADKVSFRSFAANPECSTCCGTGTVTYYGVNFDTTTTCKTTGEQTFLLSGHFMEDTARTDFKYQVITKAFQTTTFTLEY